MTLLRRSKIATLIVCAWIVVVMKVERAGAQATSRKSATDHGSVHDTGEEASSVNLSYVLRNPQYSKLMPSVVDQDMVRYFVFYEPLDEPRWVAIWKTKKPAERFNRTLVSESLTKLINDPRLAEARARRDAILDTVKQLILGMDSIPASNFVRPARLWPINASKHPGFLVSVLPPLSRPRSSGLGELLTGVVDPRIEPSVIDFVILEEGREKSKSNSLSTVSRFQGLAGITVGGFGVHGDYFVVCQDGSVVSLAAPKSASTNFDVLGNTVSQLDLRRLAGHLAQPTDALSLVSVAREEPDDVSVVIEIAGRDKRPILIARSIPMNELEKSSTGETELAGMGSLPSLFWAGCTTLPEMRQWAYSLDSNELIGFSTSGHIDFHDKLLNAADHDWLQGTSIAWEHVCLPFLFGPPQVKDGEPMAFTSSKTIKGEMSLRDFGRDPFRRIVRVVELRGERWVIYPEFKRGNLVLRKIGSGQLETKIDVPSKGRTIQYETVTAAKKLFLASCEVNAQDKNAVYRLYALEGSHWKVLEDWHRPTDRKLVFVLALDDGKPVVYSVATTMPLQFERHIIPVNSR